MANLSDNFNRADDADDLGANWTTDEGELNIVSNEAAGVTASGGFNRGRYTNSALDGNNQKVTADIQASGESGYCAARQASSTLTFYWCKFRGPWGGSESWSIGKVVSGTWTTLDNASDAAWPNPSTCWIQCDGSTLDGQINAGNALNATDSAITSGTYAGIATGWEEAVEFDDWSADDLAADVTIDVPTGALGLTGYAPTVLTPVTVDVPVGSLTLSGYAPTPLTHVSVNIPVGSVGLTGLAPTPITHVTIDVPAASLGLTGYAPTVDTGGNVTIDIPVASLTLTGNNPTILTPNTIDVPTGNLTITGYSPTVGNHITIDIPVGALTLTGFSPVVDITNHQTIDIPLGNLNLTGLTPVIATTNHQTINVPVGSITLTGYAPVIAGTTQVGKLVGSISITPVLSGSITITPAVDGSISLNPVLDGEVTIN